MHDKLLVVLSNYDGYRTSLNLQEPRYKVTVDSFIDCVPYYKDLHVLLLDNNSTDGSEQLVNEYIEQVNAPRWRGVCKQTEDYYLGTLYRLLAEYDGQYEYLMLVDNDHFFYQQQDFLGQAVTFLEQNPECVALQLNTVTREDMLDSYYPHLSTLEKWFKRWPKSVSGVFDEIHVTEDGAVFLRGLSPRRSAGVEHVTLVEEAAGSALFRYPGYPRKRLCWMSYAYHNVIVRLSAIKEVFKDPIMHPPYASNKDRLTLFSSRIGNLGDTWWLRNGASVNFGFRKYVLTHRPIDVIALLDRFRHAPPENLCTTNGYGFFVQGNRVMTDIEALVAQASKIEG